jgi:hypothetical protein
MKHSIEELIDVVYRYYPRGVSWEDPGHMQTEEHRRLVDARRRAGADCDRWLGMVRRLREQFPENGVDNFSVHLVTGYGACYSGSLYLPATTGEHWHTVGFKVSILAPYYIVYSERVVDDLAEIERRKARRATPPRYAHFFIHDTMYILPAWIVKLVPACFRNPGWLEPPPETPEMQPRRQDLSFDLSPEEQPYAAWIAQDIEATWGYERMPPDVGKVKVPGVATDGRLLGTATLYDCLFAENW